MSSSKYLQGCTMTKRLKSTDLGYPSSGHINKFKWGRRSKKFEKPWCINTYHLQQYEPFCLSWSEHEHFRRCSLGPSGKIAERKQDMLTLASIADHIKLECLSREQQPAPKTLFTPKVNYHSLYRLVRQRNSILPKNT